MKLLATRGPSDRAVRGDGGRGPGRRQLSLRLRLALLCFIVSLFLNLGLVLFINAAASLAIVDTDAIALNVPPTAFDQTSGTGSPRPTPVYVSITSPLVVDLLPKGPTPTAISMASIYPAPVTMADLAPIRETLLGQLRLVSLLGLLSATVLGALVAYWLAKRSLRSLTWVSEAARQVSVGSLKSSIALKARDNQDAEIHELTQAFEEMLDRLQEGVARQTSFASSAAHQLRNPLATLRTNLEVVGEDPEATLEDYRRMTPALHRALSRMEKLITDLLLISTTDKSLNYEPVHIGPLLENAVEDLLPLAREHGVTLRLDSAMDAVVHGDERLLQQVIANLVDNAVRYNRKDGEVRLAAEESGETVTIRVQDTGIGIAPEDRERIFERFYRTAHSARLNKAGSGLGLSIVAHLVQLHNGQMSITSGPGGSEFVVVLPATLSEAIPEPGPGLGPSVRPTAAGSTPSTARERAPRLDTTSYLRGRP